MATKKIITMLDEVHCHANAEARKTIKFALAYKSEFWKRGEHHMESEIKKQFLITGRDNSAGHFLTGLLPRIKKYCKKRGVEVNYISKNKERISPSYPAHLDKITFRPDQIKIFKKVRISQRGKIIHPTGSGKTIIALGIISMFARHKSIFIMHTKDLFMQAKKEAEKFKQSLPEIYTPSGSKEIKSTLKTIKKISKNNHHPCLVICLIQSLSKIPTSEYIDLFDLTLIDECHHVVDLNSQYGNFMQNNLSPRRYGFTASDSFKNRQKQLVNEGLIGPVIGELTTEEALEKGIIARPIVKLISVPYNVDINKKSENRYALFYKYGIAENKVRNNIIAKLTKKFNRQKQSTLIIVEKLDHGKAIQNIISRRYNIDIPFVQGSDTSETRNFWKESLLKENIYSVICSRVWLEGLNFPNLRVIIYAAGYKEKKKVLQAMGRGLRTTPQKKTVTLIDFLDPYRYLAEHSIQRIQVFIENNWL